MSPHPNLWDERLRGLRNTLDNYDGDYLTAVVTLNAYRDTIRDLLEYWEEHQRPTATNSATASPTSNDGPAFSTTTPRGTRK